MISPGRGATACRSGGPPGLGCEKRDAKNDIRPASDLYFLFQLDFGHIKSSKSPQQFIRSDSLLNALDDRQVAALVLYRAATRAEIIAAHSLVLNDGGK